MAKHCLRLAFSRDNSSGLFHHPSWRLHVVYYPHHAVFYVLTIPNNALRHDMRDWGAEAWQEGNSIAKLRTNHLQVCIQLSCNCQRQIGGLFRATGKPRSNPHHSTFPGCSIPGAKTLEGGVLTDFWREAQFSHTQLHIVLFSPLHEQAIQEPNRYYELSFKS